MIPKIIHQIWVGDEPPEFIKSAMQSVKDMHPDYEYILHGNECIEEYNLQDSYDLVPNTFLSNTIRLNKLQEYGGWYIDADMIALQSINTLGDIHNSRIASLEMYFRSSLQLVNGFFGVSKEYDLSNIIESYKPVRPMMSHWQHFITDYTPIPPELCSINGTILKDLTMNSWGKQYRELVDKRIL